MDYIRKERLMISIATLAGISCILQNRFGGWEFWIPPVVLVGMVALWWFHIAGKPAAAARINLCFTFAAFLLFYHGVHDTSLFDISASTVLFMVTFTMSDRIGLLNIILSEYIIVMILQFYFLYSKGKLNMGAFTSMRIVYHIGTVLIMYIFSRITVKYRVIEHEKIDKWQKSVRENGHDMEDFLSNISHELRTPVNVISGMTTLIRKTSDIKELSAIQAAGIRLSHQIEDIQDYTEIKRGELLLEEDDYMSISLINDVVADYNARENKNALELILDLAPETPSMLRGDIGKLHKLFRHLVDNAVKFTKKGGVYIKVFSVPHEYGVNLTIEVTDTGLGMTRADISRVSKGMYQANKKRDRSTGGIGIGLPIVYGIVHKMGGFVRINSTKGKGTTVRLSIPQSVVDPSPCLAVKEEVKKDLIFYIRPEKYKIPELRDFNRNMAINLAKGIKARLYSADDKRELEQLINDLDVSHIFTGQEEYEADHDILDKLSEDGYRVIVSANDGFAPTPGSGVLVMPKPLYGFPVVRILNGEESGFKAESTGKIRFTGVSALVVDDEPMNLVVATGLLREYRMFADTATSGKEAIEKYRSGEYDVIFMDHMMPEMDGVEAMKRIRQEAGESGKDPIIIALTANALSGAKEMFAREGFNGFIAKPIDVGEFEHVMRRVLPEDLIRSEGGDNR